MQRTKNLFTKLKTLITTKKSHANHKGFECGYFSHELARFLFPRNPHQLVMARQRCSAGNPCADHRTTHLILTFNLQMQTHRPLDEFGLQPTDRWIHGQPPIHLLRYP